MSTDKARVFISYSRADSSFVDELVRGLEWAGFDVMIDRESIVEGEDWRERLRSLIANADTVVCILSPGSVASETFAWEVDEAHRLSKRLLPILVEATDHEAVPPRLAALNYVRFDPFDDRRPRSFMEALRALTTALDTDLEWLREHTRLLARAAEWDGDSRPVARLLRGADIAAAQRWASTRPRDAPEATELHHAFIEASEREEAKRSSEERRRLEEIAAAQSDTAQALDEREIAVRKVARRTFLGIAGTTIFAGGAGVAGYRTFLAEQQAAVGRLETQAARAALRDQQDELETWKRLITEGPSSNSSSLEGGPIEIVRTAPRPHNLSGATGGWALEAVGADRSPSDGSGVVIALIGSGVETDHPVFADMELVQKDFTGEGNGDLNGHGTNLASLAFGKQVGNQRIGVATGVKKALVAKVLGGAGTSSALEAIPSALDWVTKYENGVADVVFMGLGVDYPGSLIQHPGGAALEYDTAKLLRQFLQEVRTVESTIFAARAAGKGMTFVAAAGNSRSDPAQGQRVPMTLSTALAKGFLSVGSIDNGPNVYRVSTFSPSQVTLCAPGSEVTAAQRGGGVTMRSGTSMAAAMAAGTAALWWSYLRERSPDALVTAETVWKQMRAGVDVTRFAPGVEEIDRGLGLVQAPGLT